MSLGVSVAALAKYKDNDEEGYEAYQRKFKAVNQILQQHQLPIYQEPDNYPPDFRKPTLSGQPYSWLHYLRWAYMQLSNDANTTLQPVPEGENPVNLMGDDVIDFMDSHLINHSDAEGLYLPIDFYEPLYDDDLGMMGSSVRLVSELEEIAPYLGISLINGEISDRECQRIQRYIHSQTGLYRECASWLLLFENAKNSVKYQTAMIFQ